MLRISNRAFYRAIMFRIRAQQHLIEGAKLARVR